jgi:hypothetical protein
MSNVLDDFIKFYVSVIGQHILCGTVASLRPSTVCWGEERRKKERKDKKLKKQDNAVQFVCLYLMAFPVEFNLQECLH